MSAKTDPPALSGAAPTAAASISVQPRKPRLALFIATAGGLGYLPKAPGTWGSLGGLAVAMLPFWSLVAVMLASLLLGRGEGAFISAHMDPILVAQCAIAALVAAVGTWSATRAAEFWRIKDPGRVVIDEVSGQHLTLLLGCALPTSSSASGFAWHNPGLGLVTVHTALNWKYLLVGFILFRVFDIWKPFPARQAESLPGGWGIMADDWMAAIYAGLGLWLARALGL